MPESIEIIDEARDPEIRKLETDLGALRERVDEFESQRERNQRHQLLPKSVSSMSAVGTSEFFARADHVHPGVAYLKNSKGQQFTGEAAAEHEVIDDRFAPRAGASLITGLWTFSRPAAPPFAVVGGSLYVANLDADLLDGYEGAEFGVLAENETVTGTWAFGAFPTTPAAAPTANYEVANKVYVDNEVGALLGGSGVDDIGDITLTAVADNEVLAYDAGSGHWINQTPPEAALLGLAGGEMTGNITMAGAETVDGRDLSADGADLDELYTTIGLSGLTAAEVNQVEAIGDVTISYSQWGYLGNMDQDVDTGSGVTFTGITIGANTLTTTEWANLDGLDQPLGTGDAVGFASITIDGQLVDANEWHFLDALDQSVNIGAAVSLGNITTSEDAWHGIGAALTRIGFDGSNDQIDIHGTLDLNTHAIIGVADITLTAGEGEGDITNGTITLSFNSVLSVLGGNLALNNNDITSVGTLTASDMICQNDLAIGGVLAVDTIESVPASPFSSIIVRNRMVFEEENTLHSGTNQAQFGDSTTYIARDAPTILALHADGYVRTGSGTTGHSLGADGDMLVSGVLEVDGGAWVDGIFYLGPYAGVASQIQWTEAGSMIALMYARYSHNHLLLGLTPSVGNQLIITTTSWPHHNYDHGAQTHPTTYWHTTKDPAVSNNEWCSIVHDATGMLISTGANTGAGTVPATLDNYIMFSPRGSEAMRLSGDGDAIFQGSVVTDTIESLLGSPTIPVTFLSPINIDNLQTDTDITLQSGVMALKETTTPEAEDGYGRIYCKADNKLYFQDGAGTEHELGTTAMGAVDDLTDVTITGVADNEVFAYDTGTSEWINQTPAEAGLAALAGFTMAGAIAMGANGITGMADPTNDQDAATKKYVDDSDVDATKEFFVPIAASGASTSQAYPDALRYHPCSDVSDGASAWFVFCVPADFSSLTSAVVVVAPDATEEIQWDVYCDYAALGEAYTTHGESSLDDTQAVTANQITELDVSGVMSSLAAGDYVGLRFISNTSDIRVIGLRIKYA